MLLFMLMMMVGGALLASLAIALKIDWLVVALALAFVGALVHHYKKEL